MCLVTHGLQQLHRKRLRTRHHRLGAAGKIYFLQALCKTYNIQMQPQLVQHPAGAGKLSLSSVYYHKIRDNIKARREKRLRTTSAMEAKSLLPSTERILKRRYCLGCGTPSVSTTMEATVSVP